MPRYPTSYRYGSHEHRVKPGFQGVLSGSDLEELFSNPKNIIDLLGNPSVKPGSSGVPATRPKPGRGGTRWPRVRGNPVVDVAIDIAIDATELPDWLRPPEIVYLPGTPGYTEQQEQLPDGWQRNGTQCRPGSEDFVTGPQSGLCWEGVIFHDPNAHGPAQTTTTADACSTWRHNGNDHIGRMVGDVIAHYSRTSGTAAFSLPIPVVEVNVPAVPDSWAVVDAPAVSRPASAPRRNAPPGMPGRQSGYSVPSRSSASRDNGRSTAGYETVKWDINLDTGSSGPNAPVPPKYSVGQHEREPPKRNEVEKKFAALPGWGVALRRLLHELTEFKDFIEVIGDSISTTGKCKRWADDFKAADGLQAEIEVLKNMVNAGSLDCIDGSAFLMNLLLNELEDKGIGTLSGGAQRNLPTPAVNVPKVGIYF